MPTRFFRQELEQFETFKATVEPVLRSKLEQAIQAKRLGEVNSIATVLRLLKFEVDISKQFEDLLQQTVQAKLTDILAHLDRKVKTFQSIQHCLAGEKSDDRDRNLDSEQKSPYPQIFFTAVVECLTVLYDSLDSLKTTKEMSEGTDAY